MTLPEDHIGDANKMVSASNDPQGHCAVGAGSAVRCRKCENIGLKIRTRYFETSAADVWECQNPKCDSHGLLWHVERPYNDSEKQAVRLRVIAAEGALAVARNAVVIAEVELAMARRFADELFSPNGADQPRPRE
jgi:hypothetical protein